jgi:hypothetical protein
MPCMDTKPPPSPRDLKSAGTVFWRKAVREFTFSSVELALLRQAAKTADEIAAMERDLSEMGMVTMGSRNQPRMNPLLAALVAHRKLFDQLVVALGLPTEGEVVGRRRSASAKQAADARWRKPPKMAPRIAHIRAHQNRGA